MRAEWRCVLATSGEPCVTTPGTVLMLLLSVNSWDMFILEVSTASCMICMHSQGRLHILYCMYIGGIAYSSAPYGAGSGPIYLTNVLCTGSETSLLRCNCDPMLVLSSSCTHSEDAGVRCEGMQGIDLFCISNIESLYFVLQLHVMMDS